MRTSLLGFLILLACASEASAHGSVAYGYDATNTIRFISSQNERTAEDAQAVALQRCGAAGLRSCFMYVNFENRCAAVAIRIDSFNAGLGEDADAAKRSACSPTNGVACRAELLACDRTPTVEPEVETPTPSFDWIGPFFQAMQVAYSSVLFAALILAALFLWVFVSVVSSAPVSVLKRKAAISAWIAFPTVLAGAWWFAIPESFARTPFVRIAETVLWTEVFAALVVGNAFRRRFFTAWRSPHPLSLPLAALVLTVISMGVIYRLAEFGILPKPSGCELSVESPLSLCGLSQYEIRYVGSALWLILALCGFALPADSNLIRAYDRLNASVRRSLSAFSRFFKSPTASLEIVGTGGAYPPPALLSPNTNQLWQDISVPVPSGPMMLKIRKSQTNNVWGTVIFIVDARMELSAEERYLVEKYRLGPMLIYSSSARSRHKEAIKAHLEGTKGHPVFTMSVKDQLMGVLKTFFRLGMAGAHAAMAAYHLKITVYKLMRGVHVRCKDIDEVLVAKRSIVEAAENLRTYLDAAQSFDGTEEILEF
jgi:hypothetical protein